MIDMTKMTFSPQLLKKTFFNKEMSARRWEAEPHSPPPRKVAFSQTDTIFSIPARSEMSAKEKQHAWYSRDEFLTIRDDNNRIIKDIRAGKYANSLESEARGLEYKIHRRSEERETRRMEALIAVLLEQDVQEELYGVVINDDKIAKKYAKACGHCQAEAIHMAAVDAAIVHGHEERPLSGKTEFPKSKRRSSSRRRVFPLSNARRQNLQ